jgi:hypothetical protein
MRCLKKAIAREMNRELPTTTGVASRLTVRRRMVIRYGRRRHDLAFPCSWAVPPYVPEEWDTGGSSLKDKP